MNWLQPPKLPNFPSAAEMNARSMERTLRTLSDEQAESLGDALHTLITEMEKDLKPDEEFQVTCSTAAGVITVADFMFPSWNVVTIKGMDAHNNLTILLSCTQNVQIACKVVPRQKDKERRKIGFRRPVEK
jgi:hypothetical protein